MELVSSSSFAAFTSFAAVLDVDHPGKGKTYNHKDTNLQLKQCATTPFFSFQLFSAKHLYPLVIFG